MTGEQEFNIPLDSPLDINMNDQLVPAQQPLFTYNRQKLLGGILQTSVRYEDDGYFAGWWRHQFVLINTGLNRIQPPFHNSIEEQEKNLVIYNKVTDRGVPYFVVQERSSGLRFSMATDNWFSWLTGAGEITRKLYPDDSDLLNIEGVTQLGDKFVATINIFTGEATISLPQDFYFTSGIENHAIHFTIDRILIPNNDWFIFRKNKSLIINDNLLTYRADENFSYWGESLRTPTGEFRMAHSNGVVTSVGTEFTITYQSGYLPAKGTENERVELKVRNNTIANAIITIEYYEMWSKIQFMTAEVPTPLIGSAYLEEQVNLQSIAMSNIYTNNSDSVDVPYISTVDMLHGVPIWLRYQFRPIIQVTRYSAYWEGGLIQDYIMAVADLSLSVSQSNRPFTVHGLNSDSTSIGYRYRWNNGAWSTSGNISVTNFNVRNRETGYFYVQAYINTTDGPLPNGTAIFTLRFTLQANNTWSDGTSVVTVRNGIYRGVTVTTEVPLTSETYRLLSTKTANSTNFIGGSFDNTTNEIVCAIAHCVRAYSYYKIETTDVTAAGLNSFKEYPTILPSAAGSRYIRVDKGTGISPVFSLDLVRPKIASVNTTFDSNSIEVITELESVNDRPLYYSTISEDDALVYPAWITTDNVYQDNNTMRRFIPSSRTNIFSKLNANVTIGLFVESMTPSIEFIRSLYNTYLFDSIDIETVVEKTNQRSVFDIRMIFRQEDTLIDYIDFRYNIDTGWSGPINTHFTNWYEYVTSTVPKQSDQIQRILIKFKSRQEDILILQRSFIQAWNGFVDNTLRLKSQITDLVHLAHAPVTTVSAGIPITDDGYGIIDLATHSLRDPTIVSFINTTEDTENVYKYYVGLNNSANVRIIPKGIFERFGVTKHVELTEDTTHYKQEFKLPGDDFTRTVYVDKETELNLLYETKDIRNNQKAKFVYQNNLSGMRQFVKQFWSDTIFTENYWWIDKNHVLELQRDDIIMWEKVEGKVDDWDGDKWQIMKERFTRKRYEIVNGQQTVIEEKVEMEKRVPRHYFFGIDDIYYGVSNAKESAYGPVLFKLQTAHNYVKDTGQIKILYVTGADLIRNDDEYAIFNDKNLTDNKHTIFPYTVTIDVLKKPFGSTLDINSITAFIDLNPAAVVSTSKISSTVIDGYFLLGIAYNRGLCQWTIKIPIQTVNYEIVNGYGHVGVDGSLTGGQLPTYTCGKNGFLAPVYNIDDLEKLRGRGWTEDNADEGLLNSPDTAPSLPPSRCYGTGSTIWFVNKSVPGIVSHYIFENGNFKPIELTLNNNTERRYESSSFQAAGLFDLFQPPLSFGQLFSDLFGMSAALRIVSDILLPVLFFIDLKYVMMSYINHSFGQYNYVWRNSAKDHLPEGKTDQDVKFLVDKYTQTFDQSADKASFWIKIILKSIEFADTLPVEYKVNQAQNQTATDDDVGRKYSQFFVENVASTVGDALISSGFNISLKSTISQSYTLDMFYSIDDKIQCFAGPGFVNHNFIGQCVAQCVTDTKLTGKRVGYWVTLKTLSEVVVDFKILVFEAIQKALLNLAASVGSFMFGGPALAAAFNISASIMNAVIIANQAGLKVIGQLADAIGPSTGKAYAAGTLQKYDLAIEGTHAYGNKPMNFFWPAFDVKQRIKYQNERVEAAGDSTKQRIEFTGNTQEVFFNRNSGWSKGFSQDEFLSGTGRSIFGIGNTNGLPMRGNVKAVTVKCKGVSGEVNAPERMAVVEGAKTFLSPKLFKNEQIGVAPANFPPPPIHDYELDEKWKLGLTAGAGEIIWVSCDDTKLVDGPPSNIVIESDFCGVASSYVAIEIKDLYDHRYLRPWAVTPQAIALNINKMNCVHEQKAYHAFDGQGNRILKWAGGSGMDKAVLYQQYQFQVNDHFKRSNILPPSQFFGIFEGPPSHAMRSLAPGEVVANLVQSFSRQQGIDMEIPGEQKDLRRFSIPVFSRQLSTLPAMVRMLAPYKLDVVEGITSLTTDIRNTQTRYKAPNSVDFNIYQDAYRATDEFLCSLTLQDGIVAVKDICATAGLSYIGATTKEAFFWSPATRLYYSFADGREIQKVDIMNRFLDLKEGKWDFVNQEVMFKALEKDGTIVARLDRNVLGEVFPPNRTIFSEQSDYKLLSMAGGTVYQGPKRFIVNRFVILDYMFDDIKYYNRRKYSAVFPEEYGRKNWQRVSRDFYQQDRDYGWEYVDFDQVKITSGRPLGIPDGTLVDQESIWFAIHGWTHNPKGLVTNYLGVDDITDCKFEWTFTFAWTDQMDQFYEKNEYATVNIMAETVTQGGVLKSDVTHLFLFKECFTRDGSAGHYTFKFQSNNGVGNREKLYIWGDSITALQDLKLRCKDMTSNRTQPLHTQVDVQDLVEI